MEKTPININDLPIVEWTVSDDMNEPCLFANSFVTSPAMDGEPCYLSNEKEIVKLASDDVKQTVTALLLEPFKPILRSKLNEAGEKEYYLAVITPEEIEKVKLKFLSIPEIAQSTTLEHESRIEGPRLVELWSVSDSKIDKSVALGIGPYKEGSLIATYYIPSKEMYDEFKLKGLSFSGEFKFGHVPAREEVISKMNIKTKNNNTMSKSFLTKLSDRFLNLISEIEKEEANPAQTDLSNEVIVPKVDSPNIDLSKSNDVPTEGTTTIAEVQIDEKGLEFFTKAIEEKDVQLTTLSMTNTALKSEVEDLKTQLAEAKKPTPIDVAPVAQNVDISTLTLAQRMAYNAKQLARQSS